MAKANEKQISGTHYKTPIECWDYIVANDIGYLEGNAIKYLTRWKKKNGLDDLRKAQHYLEKLIELEMEKQTTLDSYVPDAVKQWGGLVGSVETAFRPSNTMGGFCSSDNVAGQDWYGLATNPELLQDKSALDEFHMNDNVQS